MTEIVNVCAREIIDSRANPTVEAEITLSDGTVASASVPSGASVGSHEACELRDTDTGRYHKRGVLGAVKSVNEIICPALVGMSAFDIDEADSVMIALDGTYNKSRLGANAILSVSLALARAGAMSLGIPLYRYLGGALVKRMPVPMMNVINGGAHAGNNLDIQEFMIIPTGAPTLTDGVRMCSEIYHTLKSVLSSRGLSTSVGDEGGFAPSLENDEDAIRLILEATERAGYIPGEDIRIGLDVAASEWKTEKGYVMKKCGRTYTSEGLSEYFHTLVNKYPIVSIEDPLGEDDVYGWQKITELLSSRVMLVGDDLFVTSPERISEGVFNRLASAVLIKPNQIGTVSEAAEAVSFAVRGGYKTVMSHRSGDTEDSFIADFAVALSTDFIKTGAPTRAERTAKYNRLMKIEAELFSSDYGI